MSQGALGASSFIQTYIDAKGGCGRSVGALSFVLTGQDRQSPFGKPGADWTDDDLAALKTAMAECEDAAAADGNPYLEADIKSEAAELLTKIPPIVKAARLEREAQIRELEARRAMARSRIEKAERDKASARASAATEVARLENEAARAEGEARQAITSANRQVDQAARATGDTKAALADNLARLRETSRSPRGSRGAAAGRVAREEPPDQLRELQTEVRPATTNTDFVGCKKADQLVTASQGILAKNMDQVHRLVTAGECFVIDTGTSVRVAIEDTKTGSKATCVGVDGHPGCLWLPSNILKFDE